ncbi:c-type cytochrome [Sabulilitoribacter arenilitoris]|uniref:C-type cytochrome n=1 Tax=Wocania arenilitoris TaxID=2044858 RepID=A0AAE3EKT1_9FLAO|nr:c-type cytochrome [Wocania arenilitoris]MCF7567118.1 c-type cytochrome [Wocania arenilitoris]
MLNSIVIKSKNNIFFLLVLVLIIIGCNPVSFNEPRISLEQYQIEKGFKLEVVASEPFIEAPVSMDFDNSGRIWVVEMKGYMQNLEGTGQDMPNGTITILEDLDDDGVADHSKIFIDSLVLPRAIAHVYGGLLYAEPPNLWFVNIENDKPTNKVLVDSLYSDGGNVEHQPNGLMMHIDNWIYNAKSNFRYQMKSGKWIKEVASLRGQWGITKDNFGRLYYNNNSTQLIGDYVLPNVSIKNPYYKPNATLNKILTPDQRVYPLHPTSVNRGYQKGVLDKDSLLINVTSACGPLVYRGNQFPVLYNENAFVCAPEANVVKRHILTFNNNTVKAKQAIPNKEFIASTDEGFRPVNLFNGPDGNMYIVDMHRGIIQDKAFLSPYLQKHYANKKLDTIIGMGRILKVSSQNNGLKETVKIEKLRTKELVNLLNSPNGWLRDRAQQLLIFKNDKTAVPFLNEVISDVNNPIAQIHAIHTLNGLSTLDFKLLQNILSSNSKSSVKSHALVLLEEFSSSNNLELAHKLITDLLQKNNEEIDLYIAYGLGKWVQLSSEKFFPIVSKLSNKYKNNKAYQEAIINSLRGVENEFLVFLNQFKNDSSDDILYELLNQTLDNKSKGLKNSIYTSTSVGTDTRTAGFKLFRNMCATCHGIDGDGIDGLAPPLKNSEYIKYSIERLALVVLHGLSGPIHVNGKLYDTNVVMPGLANNPDFTDKDLQDIINYVNNAFSNKYEYISIEKIKSLREEKPKDGGAFTEKELLELKY